MPATSAQERVDITLIFAGCSECSKKGIILSPGFSGHLCVGSARSVGIHQVRGRRSLGRKRNMNHRAEDLAEMHCICITLINSQTFLPLLACLRSVQTGVSVFRKADLQIDHHILLDHLPTEKVN